ncbi:hypothetical protein BLNAU_18462 [Blattamonas nauphoetae]|uniref:Uncharacterized protein n=1 Tax=Blattamonas nauphoetae TaxID=2049346 RepID=A0ABQ9X4C1_9EUKA|nr:hypothetical protein BLNAU_18462 [Blattamonas nauphoetae]
MLKGQNISTEITSDEIRMQLSTILTAQTSVSLHATCRHTSTDLFFPLFKLHPNMYEMDDASGLVLDRSRSASPDAVRSVAHYLSTFLLAHIPHLTLTPRSDGTVVDESLEPKIAKMLQFVTRTAFIQSGELVFAADLIQRLGEVDMASGRPHVECIVSNNNLGTVLVVSLLLSNKIFRDVPIRGPTITHQANRLKPIKF